MEEFLKYYYNIYIDKVKKENNNYYFYENNSLFLIAENNRSLKELNEIYEICNELLRTGIPVSIPILNVNGNILSKYKNISYIVLKINCNSSCDITLNEILNINSRLQLNNNKIELYRNNWGSLWEEKVDYFEYQIKELGRDKDIILNSFSYFIGLAENAISIVNVTNLKNTENTKVCLSHKRINYPNMEIDYYNPLNFIFDLSVRDIAEYLKSMFFYTDRDLTLKEFNAFINKIKLTNYEANMFYARMLYPSYYFDIYERVIENQKDEEELLNIISKTEEYELFLKDVYLILSKYYNVEKIKWIINKKEL